MLSLLQTGLVLGDELGGPLVSSQLVATGLKILFLIAFGLYVAFAFIATRQIQIMRKTIITPFSSTLHLIGLAHFALTVIVFVLFLLVL